MAVPLIRRKDKYVVEGSSPSAAITSVVSESKTSGITTIEEVESLTPVAVNFNIKTSGNKVSWSPFMIKFEGTYIAVENGSVTVLDGEKYLLYWEKKDPGKVSVFKYPATGISLPVMTSEYMLISLLEAHGETLTVKKAIYTPIITSELIQANSILSDHIKAGELEVGKNIFMAKGATISWGSVDKTGASAADVKARDENWKPTPGDIGALPVGWLPTLTEIGAMGLNPSTPTVIGANWLYTGTVYASQIVADSISAISANLGSVTAGNISGVNISGSSFSTDLGQWGLSLNGDGFKILSNQGDLGWFRIAGNWIEMRGAGVEDSFKVSLFPQPDGSLGVNGRSVIDSSGYVIQDSTHRFVTDDQIYNWNNSFGASHSHDNKAVLDNITQLLVNQWNTAYTNNHTHSNKANLDSINQNLGTGNNVAFTLVVSPTFQGNLTGYKNVDNGNEVTLANGFAGGVLCFNYRGSASATTETRFYNGKADGGLSDITAKVLKSEVGTGTAPFVVSSTTQVSNLNADLWQGWSRSSYLDQAVKTTSKPSFSGAIFSSKILVTAADQSTARIQIQNTTTNGHQFDLIAGVHNVTQECFSIYDATAGATRLRIENDGSVTIGGGQKVGANTLYVGNATLSGNLTVNGTGSSVFLGNVLVTGDIKANYGSGNIFARYFYDSASNLVMTLDGGSATFGGALILNNDNAVYWKDSGGNNIRSMIMTSSAYHIGSVDNNFSGSMYLKVGGDNTMYFYTNAVLRAYLSSAKFYTNVPLTVDSTGNNYFAGNVGIGTTSPSQKLDVNGNINVGAGGSADVPAIIIGWAGNGIYSHNSSTVALTSSHNAGLFVSNGKTGIATTTFTEALNVNGNTKQWGDIYSDNWNGVDPYTGYYIGKNGSVFSKITANELHVKAFIADLEMALAGSQIIAPSVAKLYSDCTIGAAVNSTATLVVEEIPGFQGHVLTDTTDTNIDYIRLRNQTRNDGGLSVVDVWGKVVFVSRDDTTKTQTYTFTKLGGTTSQTTISKGTLALDYGKSGSGIYETVAQGPLGKTPYSQIATWTTTPYTDMKIRSRVGDLTGVPTTTYGALKTFGIYTQDFFGEGNTNIVGTLTAGDANGWGNTFYAGKITKNLLRINSDNAGFGSAYGGGSNYGFNSGTGITQAVTTDPDKTLFGSAIKIYWTNTNSTVTYLETSNRVPANLPVGKYVLSFFVKGSKNFPSNTTNWWYFAATGMTITTLSPSNFHVTTEWQRVYAVIDVTSPSATLNYMYLVLTSTNDESLSDWVSLTGFQFESGAITTPYQKVDGAAPYGSGYGMWSIAGGFGGTIQNPAIALTDSGIMVRGITGKEHAVTTTNGVYIGNYTAGTGFNGTVLNENGLYGYQNATVVMKVDTSGALLGNWKIEGTQLSSTYGSMFLVGGANPKMTIMYDGSNYLTSWYDNADSWGITGIKGGYEYFRLGSENRIAGWKFEPLRMFKKFGSWGAAAVMAVGATYSNDQSNQIWDKVDAGFSVGGNSTGAFMAHFGKVRDRIDGYTTDGTFSNRFGLQINTYVGGQYVPIFEVSVPDNSTTYLAQIAGFSFTDQYFNKGNIYIGNNLMDLNAENRLFIGNGEDGTYPMVRFTGTGIKEMRLASDGTKSFFAIFDGSYWNFKAGDLGAFGGANVTGVEILNNAGAQVFRVDSGGTSHIGGVHFSGNSLYSSNYDSTHGFAINSDGSAVFNNVTVRGSVFAGNITSTATITGGTLSGSTISGGSINIGSGKFTVDTLGNVTQSQSFSSVTLSAGMLNIDYGGYTTEIYATDAHSGSLIINTPGGGVYVDGEKLSTHDRFRGIFSSIQEAINDLDAIEGDYCYVANDGMYILWQVDWYRVG